MGGFAQQVWQRDQTARDDQLKMQIAPLSEALRADQTRLALYANPDDPSKPLAGKEAEYNATHDRMAQTIGQMRRLYGQNPQGANPVEAGVGSLLDKLHITNHLKNHVADVRAANAKKYADQTSSMTGSYTEATPINPLIQSQIQAQQAGASPAELEAMRNPLTRPQDKTDQDKFITDYMQRNPKATREDALRAFTDATTKDTSANKPNKGIGFVGSETAPIGLKNLDTGVNYLPSQLGPNGNAPPEYKEAWKSIQDAKKAKQDDEERKEDERDKRQAQTIGAAFDRMGRSQEFQENMAQYRSDLQTYRTLDTQADQSDEQVQALKTQYAQPGNHAVADNELQNFYTTVVQKGGRKTAAELNLTLKIGSFGMNLKQMADKAASGELPDELRKALLSGMEAVAKEQRATADNKKPTLPEITAPEGPKTKALKNKAAQNNKDPLGVL